MSHIYLDKLNQILREIPHLSSSEREYVKGIFAQYGSGGIDKLEAQKAIRQMKFNFSDTLDSYEVSQIQNKIQDAFE